MTDDAILVQSIPKNSLDEIRVSLLNYRGFDLLDIRTYSERRDSKERAPTPKGISLKVSQIDELIDTIRHSSWSRAPCGSCNSDVRPR